MITTLLTDNHCLKNKQGKNRKLNNYINNIYFWKKFTSKLDWRKFIQPTTSQLIKPFTCPFSHMAYLMSHVTYLNNTCR